MATIRFSSSHMERRVTVDVEAADRPTLLSLAREHGVPIPFNCQSGDCGSCMVRVETISVGSGPASPLTDGERLVLTAARRLTADDIAEAERCGMSPEVRLACQYRLGDEEIAVMFESELGAG
jgi:ferredoxin